MSEQALQDGLAALWARSTPRQWLWSAFLLLCAMLLTSEFLRTAEYQATIQRIFSPGRDEAARVQLAWIDAQRKLRLDTPDNIEQYFTRIGAPLKWANDERERATWTDPVYWTEFDFHFRNGHLGGWGSGSGSPPRPYDWLAGLRPEPLGLIRIWLILFAIALFWPRRRALIAEGLTVFGLVWAVAAAINPLYSFTLRGMSSNDDLCGAVALTAIAAGLWLPLRIRCSIQFTVTQLFLLIAAASVLAAAAAAGASGLLLVAGMLVGIGLISRFFFWYLGLVGTSGRPKSRLPAAEPQPA